MTQHHHRCGVGPIVIGTNQTSQVGRSAHHFEEGAGYAAGRQAHRFALAIEHHVPGRRAHGGNRADLRRGLAEVADVEARQLHDAHRQ